MSDDVKVIGGFCLTAVLALLTITVAIVFQDKAEMQNKELARWTPEQQIQRATAHNEAFKAIFAECMPKSMSAFGDRTYSERYTDVVTSCERVAQTNTR